MARQKKNKISIYLIKESIPEDEIVILDANIKEVSIGKSTLHVRPSSKKLPKWIEGFFGTNLPTEDLGIFSAITTAVLVTSTEYEGAKRIFAITFGMGHTLLEPGVFEERFGLKVVLNAVDEKHLRSIVKKNMGALFKQSREQAGRSAETQEFGIDIEQDLVQEVAGLSSDDRLGKMISGKDSLHLSVPNNLESISELLRVCLTYSNSSSYQQKFPWIDLVAEVRNKQLVAILNKKLLDKLNKEQLDGIWMAIPEIIDWGDFESFKFKTSAKAPEHADLLLTDFLSEFEAQKGQFNLDILKHARAYCNFENKPAEAWSIYSCLYVELEYEGSVYTLTNSKWYKIDKDFSDEVAGDFKNILKINHNAPELPPCPVRKGTEMPVVEPDYNRYASEKTGFDLLDKNLARIQGSSIEVCDLYAPARNFIHIKHYGGSSVLSHLFNQALVSGELFLMEANFRTQFNSKVSAVNRLSNPTDLIDARKYAITLGIISNKGGSLEIPFFSKISLRHVVDRLNLYGFKTVVVKVPVDTAAEI